MTTLRNPVTSLAGVGLLVTLTACSPAVVGAKSSAAAPSLTTPSAAADSSAAAPSPAKSSAAITSEHTAVEMAAATAILGHIAIGARGAKTGYLRTVVFGSAWVDVNANGCGTRDDILTRDLAGMGKRNSCVVVSGLLHDPYTGKAITFRKADASAVQIDHVIPLGLAWQLGAAQWSQGKRVTFANDPANLLAVDGSANESKSDSGPDSWLPPSKAYGCTYVIHFASVANLYGLRITSSMRDTIAAQLHGCKTVVGDPAGLTALPSSDWTRAARIGGSSGASAPAAKAASTTTPGTKAPPAATTRPPASTGGDAYYANCAAVRAAGKAPLHRGEPTDPVLTAMATGLPVSKLRDQPLSTCDRRRWRPRCKPAGSSRHGGVSVLSASSRSLSAEA